MQFAFTKPYEWLPREQELLKLVAERCLLGAEKVKLMQHLAESENQIRELASRMMQVEEVERRRISRLWSARGLDEALRVLRFARGMR
jgi:GAF domain-containing protein